MNKKIVKIFILVFLIIAIANVSNASKEKIIIDDNTFSFTDKENDLLSNFDSSFEIEKNNTNKNHELKQTITELTKRATYLLLGEANSKKESSEDYFKRHKDYLNLRYNPQIPKDENGKLDTKSKEYSDDVLSGIVVPGMFLKLNELDVKYNAYGKINVSVIDDMNVVSSIALTNVTMKKQDENEPMNYNIIKTNLTIYYYFKKINNEYKLLYLYGETQDEIEQEFDKNDETKGTLSKDANYNSNLKDVYDFSKADAVTDQTLTNIYNKNKSKIVFLNSIYNTGTVESANGFFINEGLIITTYNYIEKSLIKAQDIIISDSLGNIYKLDGIVTMNLEDDIAILKVKDRNQNYIEITNGENIKKEDAVITLNSKIGVGLNTAKGIITSIDKDNMQTSLITTEEMQGSPIFNSNEEVIGMLNSQSLNTSISSATQIDIISKYNSKLEDKGYDNIKAISFKDLKENYYIKYNEEKVIKNIPKSKWQKYNKAENIEETIELELIKSSYKDGIISLRYKNEIPNYIDTMQFASKYEETLKSKGYKEKNISNSKKIYESKKYKIIIMTEFDYLIIVMVKV